MRKAVLEQNILPKAKQRFIVEGAVTADLLVVTRDPISVEVGTIDLPDQTKVPGGRRRAGEFSVTIQMANDNDRRFFVGWANKAVDRGDNGIQADYKKNVTMKYLRLYSGLTTKRPVQAKVKGVWVHTYQSPDYDMNGDEGDGDSMMELNMNYDDAFLDEGFV